MIVKGRQDPTYLRKNSTVSKQSQDFPSEEGGKYRFRKCSYYIEIPGILTKTKLDYLWRISDAKGKPRKLGQLASLALSKTEYTL